MKLERGKLVLNWAMTFEMGQFVQVSRLLLQYVTVTLSDFDWLNKARRIHVSNGGSRLLPNPCDCYYLDPDCTKITTTHG